ncbi:hypothetical protein QJS10_CPA01g01962 [Acorus calamus]|uniref:Uncharacterized protein n=1 Tax=Acorus calamus TaxID=4465 RepID=A0AAV9FGZ3_ACOCL|nr:hypothetical protein QJS10_CPA01g01962 [Acorus calamus]
MSEDGQKGGEDEDETVIQMTNLLLSSLMEMNFREFIWVNCWEFHQQNNFLKSQVITE